MKDDALGIMLLGGGVAAAGALAWRSSRTEQSTLAPNATWIHPVPNLGDRVAVVSNEFRARGAANEHLGVDLMFKRRDARDLIAVYPPSSTNGSRMFFMPDAIPALAASAGVVTFAAMTPVGNTVIVKHSNGWVTYYTHLVSLAVKRGDIVTGSQRLGTIGASPQDAAHLAHLHFELWKGGTRSSAIDPAPFLAAWSRVTSPWSPAAPTLVAATVDRPSKSSVVPVKPRGASRRGFARQRLANLFRSPEQILSGTLRGLASESFARDWSTSPRNGALSAYRPVGDRGEPYPEWVRALKGEAGVYVIRDADTHEVVYVGSSAGRLYDTLTRHFQTWRRWKGFWKGQYSEGADPGLTYPRGDVEVAVRLTSPNDSLDEEMRLIARLRPRDNQIGQPDPAADELIPF